MGGGSRGWAAGGLEGSDDLVERLGEAAGFVGLGGEAALEVGVAGFKVKVASPCLPRATRDGADTTSGLEADRQAAQESFR